MSETDIAWKSDRSVIAPRQHFASCCTLCLPGFLTPQSLLLHTRESKFKAVPLSVQQENAATTQFIHETYPSISAEAGALLLGACRPLLLLINTRSNISLTLCVHAIHPIQLQASLMSTLLCGCARRLCQPSASSTVALILQSQLALRSASTSPPVRTPQLPSSVAPTALLTTRRCGTFFRFCGQLVCWQKVPRGLHHLLARRQEPFPWLRLHGRWWRVRALGACVLPEEPHLGPQAWRPAIHVLEPELMMLLVCWGLT